MPNDLCVRDYLEYPLMAVRTPSFSVGFEAFGIESLELRKEIQAYHRSPDPSRESEMYRILGNGVAEITFEGPVRPSRPWWSDVMGMDDLEEAFVRAGNDKDVQTIIFRIISTPGGSASRLESVSKVIVDLREQKEVLGFVQDHSYSAGMWLMSQCTRIVCDPTSHLGGLGVFSMLIDTKEMAKAIGVARIIVSSGGVKGLEFADEVDKKLIEDRQREVEESAEIFKAAFLRGRNFDGRVYSTEEIEKMFDGRGFQGQRAIEARMADEVLTYRDFLNRVVVGKSETTTDQPSTETDMADENEQAAKNFLKALEFWKKSGSSAEKKPESEDRKKLREALVEGARNEQLLAARQQLEGTGVPSAHLGKAAEALAMTNLESQMKKGSASGLTGQLINLGGISASEVFPDVNPGDVFLQAINSMPKFVGHQQPNLLQERPDHPAGTEGAAPSGTKVDYPKGTATGGFPSGMPTWEEISASVGAGIVSATGVTEDDYKQMMKERGLK